MFLTGVPILIIGGQYINDFRTNSSDIRNQSPILIGIGSAFMGIGFILDIVALIMFGTSNRYYKKYKKSLIDRFSFNFIFNNYNDHPVIAITFNIKI